MDIGLLVPVSAPYASRRFVHELGSMAEESGFHSLWVGEHVVIPENSLSEYPAGDGELPAAVRNGELDPYGTLAYLAAITERIRLGACTTLPQRNPVYTAKEIANADWLSEGRIDVGVGVGWSKEEYEAVAASFAHRGSRCDSYVRVMQACWTDSVSEYHDEFYDLLPSRVYPKPIQTPHPPIHILGQTPPALRRAARYGDGFFPLDGDPDTIGMLIDQLDQLLGQEGRTREEIRVTASPYTRETDLDLVARYRDAGADQVILFQFVEDLESMRRAIDHFAEQIVVPAARL